MVLRVGAEEHVDKNWQADNPDRAVICDMPTTDTTTTLEAPRSAKYTIFSQLRVAVTIKY